MGHGIELSWISGSRVPPARRHRPFRECDEAVCVARRWREPEFRHGGSQPLRRRVERTGARLGAAGRTRLSRIRNPSPHWRAGPYTSAEAALFPPPTHQAPDASVSGRGEPLWFSATYFPAMLCAL
jgi:hypothetical protein